MKAVVIIKAKLGVIAKKEVDTIEFAIQEINGVERATFDRKNSKVELEYEDSDDFDLIDIALAIQNTGKFTVVNIG